MIKKCKKIIKDAVTAIENLGESPKRSKVLKIIQRAVEAFNDLDEKACFIETDEREALTEIFD
ncbi:MAG: hypothetical protein P1V97_33880 [Planctomycetota bacterium]|nr:hypothetical protein [Planctomycetota bacterium]